MHFSTNDVLVDLSNQRNKLFFTSSIGTAPLEEFPKTILREAEKSLRESGVNSLCAAIATVSLPFNDGDVQIPILIQPLSFTRKPLEQSIVFSVIEDSAFLNPFLVHHLTHALKLELPIWEEDQPLLDQMMTFLESHSLTVQKNESVIGNFHHHRYQIIKELEDLQKSQRYSSELKAILGTQKTNCETIDLSSALIFPADTDQLKVFEQVKNGSLVIQGPPGTGKSQVLSNLLAKFTADNTSMLVVSEKRSALEILVKKLGEFKLDKFCFIGTSDRLSHSFIQSLKDCWDYLDTYVPEPIVDLRLSNDLSNHLQMTFDMLSQTELIGGVSFHEFLEHSKGISLSGTYRSRIPEIPEYIEHQKLIGRCYSEKISDVVGQIKHSAFQRKDFDQLDTKIHEWIETLTQLNHQFSIQHWADLSEAMKTSAQVQIFENAFYKKHAELFRPDSKEQKRFLRLRKSYLKLQKTVDQSLSEWKIVPSKMEVEALHDQLESGSFFEKRRARKRWKDLSHLSVEHAPDAIATLLDKLANDDKFAQTLIKFCDLGIESPETDIESIHQTLGAFTPELWKIWDASTAEERRFFTDHHQTLHALYQELKDHFVFLEKTEIAVFLNSLLNHFPWILSQRKELSDCSQYMIESLAHYSSLDDLVSGIFTSHYSQFQDRFPTFSSFQPSEIREKVEAIIQAQNTEFSLFATMIEQSIHERFVDYHTLLSTPARKLNESQKQLKQRLRKGKSLLVKEFNKTRRHPSLRELFESDAREWIQLLKPVWLSNPSQLAKSFPMEEQLFDVAIFDEASQIPLQNALGAIQRSKRVVIAGDEHQMGPTSYFTKGTAEQLDLLHQANYYLPRVAMNHHYRSEHPNLIRFSNIHFYGNELKAYPAQTENHPVLRRHFIETGTFHERKNIAEAEKMAELIQHRLTEPGSIGIVAFSEEQLNCIWSMLSSSSQEQITKRIENRTAFFKALENVQGDECDHLMISFGYGKNAEGEFHMRFGPMNTPNGRKRLNVLLTRAIKSIDFICSVSASDFKLTDNESINLLAKWFRFIENNHQDSAMEFPFGLTPAIDGSGLTFHAIHRSLPNAKEITTLHRVLQHRGWNLQYS